MRQRTRQSERKLIAGGRIPPGSPVSDYVSRTIDGKRYEVAIHPRSYLSHARRPGDDHARCGTPLGEGATCWGFVVVVEDVECRVCRDALLSDGFGSSGGAR